MSDDPYVYTGTSVLRNKLGLTDAASLAAFERQIIAQRMAEGVPSGVFDLDHLRAIHRHLFQDVYDWAGEIRTAELAKGRHQFMFRQYIERGMADVTRRIVAARIYEDWSLPAFAAEAGRVLRDVNYIHPFREGNGRTQLQFLEQFCQVARRRLDLREIDPEEWLAASRIAHDADYDPMGRAIRAALDRSLQPNASERLAAELKALDAVPDERPAAPSLPRPRGGSR